MQFLKSVLVALCLFIPMASSPASAADDTSATPDQRFLLTIFLKHDQSKTLDEIQAELNASGFWAKFPPEGIHVESWYVMMGIGQVVTISVPPNRLREVNRIIEQTAWGSFRTDFYPTYDLSGVAKDLRKKAQSAQK